MSRRGTLSSPTDVPRERRRPMRVASTTSPRQRSGGSKASQWNASNLCATCTQIDFDALFDNGDLDTKDYHRVYGEWFFALDSVDPDCALCRMTHDEARFAEKALNQHSTQGYRYAYCILKHHIVQPQESRNIWSRFAIACFCIGQIFFHLVYENSIPPIELATHKPHSVLHLERVDDCHLLVSKKKLKHDPSELFAQRCILPTTFDIVKLRAWLHENDRMRSIPASSELTTLAFQEMRQNESFRVIDVNTGMVHAPQEEVRYVALSYVWGAPNSVRESACQQPLIAAQSLFDTPGVPRTILDAMAIVESLGEKYLWVDAVCIVQSSAKDKQSIIPHMGSIYSNAYLTIIATDGEDSEAGIGRLMGASAIQEAPIVLRRNDEIITVIKGRHSLEDVLQKTRWQTRGWTYQEAEMSGTTVICTSDEVFFQSENLNAREAYEPVDTTFSLVLRKKKAKPRTRDHFATERFPFNYLSRYQHKVEEYTRRQLTYPGDRLDAFAAVAQAAEPDISMAARHALSGLTEKSFAIDLSWDFDGPARHERLRRNHRGTRHLPSWSWIGWEGPVRMQFPIIDVKCEIKDESNVTCNLARAPWIGEILLDKPTPVPHVTLHLWTRLLGCRFDDCIVNPAQDLEQVSIKCHTYIFFPGHAAEASPLDKILPQHLGFSLQLDNARSGSHHFLVPTGGSYKRFLIVESSQSYYERVGSLVFYDLHSELGHLEQWTSDPVYIRLR